MTDSTQDHGQCHGRHSHAYMGLNASRVDVCRSSRAVWSRNRFLTSYKIIYVLLTGKIFAQQQHKRHWLLKRHCTNYSKWLWNTSRMEISKFVPQRRVWTSFREVFWKIKHKRVLIITIHVQNLITVQDKKIVSYLNFLTEAFFGGWWRGDFRPTAVLKT